jgi:subtilisin family serine protease
MTAKAPPGVCFAIGCAIAVTACAWALSPAVASGLSPGGEGTLSSRLAELARPSVRNASRGEQAGRLSLAPRGPGSLLRDGNRVLADVRFGAGAGADLGALRAVGAEVVHYGRRFQTVTVAVLPAALRRVAAVAGVEAVTEILAPLVLGADCGGLVRSEGDTQLNAASARASFGVDGSGVEVGILSDSFDRDASTATHAAGDVASGDLPGPGSPCGSTTPVDVLQDFAAGDDEGRAMAQIVHDLAPGVAIDFASAFTGELKFAANIRALANAGAEVIVDDVSYLEEPVFQDGPVARAVNDVAATGVSHFSAAGNDNLIDAEGRDIGSWEAPAFRDAGTCPAAIVTLSEELEKAEEEEGVLEPEGLHPSHCMDFDPGVGSDETLRLTVEEGATLGLNLQWAEPWFGVDTDVDAFLLDEAGELVTEEGFPVLSVDDNVGGSQRPFEFFFWENAGPEQDVQLVFNRFDGAEPRIKMILPQNGGGVSASEYPVSSEGDVVGPTVSGHSGAAGAIAVGAVPFFDDSAPEEYSSRGPVVHYFGPVAGVTPAAAIPPETIVKPDLAASDCGVTTFFASLVGGVWRFCGTSAAAPHAAAVAALMRQANPGASAAQVRAALAATARPVGAFGPNAVGAGLIDAHAAVDSVALPPTVTITKAPAPLSRERRPTIEFTANRPVAFTCHLDGSAQPCASPFTVPADLDDGGHGIAVTATDLSGRVGSSGVVSFVVDTRAPRTSFAKRPPKLIRTHRSRARAIFRFHSSEPVSTFICKVDRGLLHFCGAKLSRRYEEGLHTVRVRARDAAGNVDRTPAVFRFRVERIE